MTEPDGYLTEEGKAVTKVEQFSSLAKKMPWEPLFSESTIQKEIDYIKQRINDLDNHESVSPECVLNELEEVFSSE